MSYCSDRVIDIDLLSVTYVTPGRWFKRLIGNILGCPAIDVHLENGETVSFQVFGRGTWIRQIELARNSLAKGT